MDSPRRSARLARNQPSNTSTFSRFSDTSSRFSSTSALSFPSPDNPMNDSGLHQSQSHASLQIPSSSYLSAPVGANAGNAPLPSPSTADMNQFQFVGRPHSQPSLMSSASFHGQQGVFDMGSQQAQASLASQQAQQFGHQPPSMPQPNHTAPLNRGPLPPDFDVLAEAAKRAQMACLMRDLDEVTL